MQMESESDLISGVPAQSDHLLSTKDNWDKADEDIIVGQQHQGLVTSCLSSCTIPLPDLLLI